MRISDWSSDVCSSDLTIGLIEDEDILLDVASLALSHLDHENTDIARYLEMLEEIEDRVCHEGRSAFLPGERAAVLSRVLHGEQIGRASCRERVCTFV